MKRTTPRRLALSKLTLRQIGAASGGLVLPPSKFNYCDESGMCLPPTFNCYTKDWRCTVDAACAL